MSRWRNAWIDFMGKLQDDMEKDPLDQKSSYYWYHEGVRTFKEHSADSGKEFRENSDNEEPGFVNGKEAAR